jgi:hypothetical protein
MNMNWRNAVGLFIISLVTLTLAHSSLSSQLLIVLKSQPNNASSETLCSIVRAELQQVFPVLPMRIKNIYHGYVDNPQAFVKTVVEAASDNATATIALRASLYDFQPRQSLPISRAELFEAMLVYELAIVEPSTKLGLLVVPAREAPGTFCFYTFA